MPFGLTNTPRIFIRLMTEVLHPYLGNFVALYLDDSLIYSRSKGEQLQCIKIVLEVLNRKKLHINLKCKLFKQALGYLGFVTSWQGLSMDPKKVKVILDWQYHTMYMR